MGKRPTKRQLQAMETKQKIYDSACKLFKEKGFANVTMEEITSAVGLTAGTFYRYFSTKHEILVILYSQLDASYEEFAQQVLSSDKYKNTSAITRLQVFTEHNMETCVKDGLEYVNVIYPYMKQSVEFAQSMFNPERAYFRIVHGLFTEGQQNGEIRYDIPADRLATDLAMVTRGCIVDWEMHRCPGKISDWGKTAIECFLIGVKK